MRLTLQQWRALLRWFVRGAPSAEIARETRLDRKRVLRALTVVRRALICSTPANVRSVSDTEIAAGPHAEQHGRAGPQKSVKPPKRRATLGLSAAHGHTWAEVIPDAESEQLGRILRERSDRQSIIVPGPHRYTAVVHRGRLYRLAESGAGRAPFGQIEAFWAYLQRHLRAKGGIRRERLGLYLAEFAWRYNHRKVPPAEQVRALLTLIGRSAVARSISTSSNEIMP